MAAAENSVFSPLVYAEFSKADVRELAKLWGLPVWDKPATPCLSSRIAYGVEVTPERVRMIDAAEQFLLQLTGVQQLRVRLEYQQLARIEVPLDQLAAVAAPATSDAVVKKLLSLGFCSVTLDLQGFRSGSMNSVLGDVQNMVELSDFSQSP